VRRLLASYGELVLVCGLGVLAQAELWLDTEWTADRYVLAPVALGMAALLLLRLRAPLLTLLLEVAGLEVATAVNTVPDNDPMSVVLPVMVALYSAGAHTRGRMLGLTALAVAGATLLAVHRDGESWNVSGFLFFGFFLGAPFLVGIAIRARRERERFLERERDEKALAAVAEERTRIARELHDVVAHAISVIVLQARGARHALAEDPDDTRRAIDAIERTASQALGEMRRLLAILRADDEAVALAPEASLSQLAVLADEVRAAGLPVEIRVEGEPRELSPGLDASAYRIVQEALTNALKHAGASKAIVVVDYGDELLEIEVVDNGVGVQNGDGAGHGLLGMRERAAVFGGRVEAGPRNGGGYGVRARLPL
jgi:signal transduction histidine kinase